MKGHIGERVHVARFDGEDCDSGWRSSRHGRSPHEMHDFERVEPGVAGCLYCPARFEIPDAEGFRLAERERRMRVALAEPLDPPRRRLPFRWRVVRALFVVLVIVWAAAWLVAPDALTADAMVWGGITIAGHLPLPGFLGG